MLLTWANDLPQASSIQTKGRSLKTKLLFFSKKKKIRNVKVVPPVCSLRWLFKFVIWVKAFPQSTHAYGRWFVWILSWFRRLAAWVKPINNVNQVELIFITFLDNRIFCLIRRIRIRSSRQSIDRLRSGQSSFRIR